MDSIICCRLLKTNHRAPNVAPMRPHFGYLVTLHILEPVSASAKGNDSTLLSLPVSADPLPNVPGALCSVACTWHV